MNSCNRSFVKGFEKVAKEDWFDISDWGQQIPNSARKVIKKKMAGKDLDSNTEEVGGHYKDWLQTAAGKKFKSDYAKKNFVTKQAAPAWYYRMNKTMNPLKSMKNHSVKGLKAIKAAEGLK